jgi:hypothetical protein
MVAQPPRKSPVMTDRATTNPKANPGLILVFIIPSFSFPPELFSQLQQEFQDFLVIRRAFLGITDDPLLVDDYGEAAKGQQ